MTRFKTIILASLILLSSASQANPRHHHGYHNRSDWLAPIVIGSVVGYVLTRPQPQTVIVQNPPNIQPQPVPYGYHYETILDANCNCYRLVLVQNQP